MNDDKGSKGKRSDVEVDIKGFKCGLEIHQRLDTHKLFCNCPSPPPERELDHPVKHITRRLHFVKSELGETDRTALFETSRNPVVTYQFDNVTACEVELDESPPMELNREALKIALTIAKLFNARIVDEVHVMRKQVVDGSNTSGFQRTAIVAMNGYVNTSKGKVRIDTVCLEEESAGIIDKDSKVFSLDRLGIPLVEISTAPDIKDPEHAKETAEKIGAILRLAKVQRGLGTIRQDVNVSVSDGARVEIKGVQDLSLLPTILVNEVKRQRNTVKLYNEKIKGLLDRNKQVMVIEVTELFDRTECKVIRSQIKKGGIVLALKLVGFKGVLGTELVPGVRFGTELAKYAAAAGVKGIIHSDEDLDRYNLDVEEISTVRLALDMNEDDAFILIAGERETVYRAVDLLIYRLFYPGVPEETRAARGPVTLFMRPLPGRARMYPETDIPPIPITSDMLASLPKVESLEDVINRYERLVGKEYAKRVLNSRYRELFDTLVSDGYDPKLVANIILEKLVSLRREGLDVNMLTAGTGATIRKVLDLYKGEVIVKSAIEEVLRKVCETGFSPETVVKEFKLKRITGDELEKVVRDEGYDMKRVMSKYRLVVSPEDVIAIIKKHNKSR